MKFIWEEDDIEVGRRVYNKSGNDECIIGYRYSGEKSQQHLTLVVLTDGMEFSSYRRTHKGSGIDKDAADAAKTAESLMAEFFNEYEYIPKTLTKR